MPLTVDEVSAAPGLARSRPSAPSSGVPRPPPPPPGRRVHCWRQGNLVEHYLQNLEAGGRGRGIAVSTCHPSGAGRRWVGQWTPGGPFRDTQNPDYR